MNSPLLSIKYWFKMNPGELFPIYEKALILFLVILIVLFLVLSFIKKSGKYSLYNKIWKSLRSFSVVNIIFAGLLLFFTNEMIPFLSSRFWFLIMGIEMLAWLYFVQKKFKEIPIKKQQLEKEKEFKKYIP